MPAADGGRHDVRHLGLPPGAGPQLQHVVAGRPARGVDREGAAPRSDHGPGLGGLQDRRRAAGRRAASATATPPSPSRPRRRRSGTPSRGTTPADVETLSPTCVPGVPLLTVVYASILPSAGRRIRQASVPRGAGVRPVSSSSASGLGAGARVSRARGPAVGEPSPDADAVAAPGSWTTSSCTPPHAPTSRHAALVAIAAANLIDATSLAVVARPPLRGTICRGAVPAREAAVPVLPGDRMQVSRVRDGWRGSGVSYRKGGPIRE